MNIFVLDESIETCARYHCDQHVGKMVLESVQILCTALNLKGFHTPYRSTHAKHPCVLWAGESWDNFQWLSSLAESLNREFCWRFDRDTDHASITVLSTIENLRFESVGLTPFAQAMPDIYKVPGDPVAAYRGFYRGEKSAFATWRKRQAPTWFSRSEQLAEG
ncbi:MAG: pyrimidine dimer DNA glycosylase/endonuclease V [bacterium]